jgi:three-Cys-motif partner protein
LSGSQEFFRERRAQAVFKHGILTRYPVVFASKTGWSGRPVVFLDGYAGRGRYEDGSPGSPVLLAESAARMESRNITGIYVERERNDFDNLIEVMAALVRPTDRLLSGNLEDHLPSILDVARDSALFAFLDPFGTALDREQLVGQLLGRPKTDGPTEVLLHISISTVARIGGLLRRRREDGQELSEKDRKTVAHANRFLGGTWWHEHFEPVGDEDDPRATAAALRVAAAYQEQIRAEVGCRSVSMPIQHRPGQLPKYLLVLFTWHLDGLWYFADAVGKAGREWEGAWRTADVRRARDRASRLDAAELSLLSVDEVLPQPAEFDCDEYERERRATWTSIIADNIERLLAAEGPFVPAERLDMVYADVFGAASERHVRAAIKDLHDRGIVLSTGKGRHFYNERLIPTDAPTPGAR